MVKIYVKYCLTSVRIATIKKKKTTNVGKDVEVRKPL